MGPDETIALLSSWTAPIRTFIIDLYYSGIITFVAALAAVVGALIALKQARTAVRARHGQTFMSIMQYANTIKFTDHLNKIRSLTADELIEAHEEHILPVADFFNDLGHLIEGGFIPSATLIQLYYPGIDECREKLMKRGQWLESKRERALRAAQIEGRNRNSTSSGASITTPGGGALPSWDLRARPALSSAEPELGPEIQRHRPHGTSTGSARSAAGRVTWS